MNIVADLINFDYWRAVMYSSLREQLADLNLTGCGVEFGGNSNGIIQGYCPGVSWEDRDYPPYDVQEADSWEPRMDVAVLDMVIEHVPCPWKVFENMGSAVRKVAIITTPFLVGIHPPIDYWRLTENAYKALAEPYFSKIDVRCWGNNLANSLLFVHHDQATMMANTPEAVWRGGLSENDPVNPFLFWAVLQK